MKRKPIEVKHDSVTVPIYRADTSNGYHQFTVAWKQDGRRCRKFFGQEEKAREHAKKIAKDLAEGNKTATALGVGEVRSYTRAMEIIKDTGLSLESVCKDYVSAVKQLEGRSLADAVAYYVRMHPKDMPAKLVSEVAEELYANKKELRRSEAYIGQLRHQCGKFAKMFSKIIADITADDVKLFTDSMSELAPKTKNNVINGVRELFRFARRRKYIPKDFDELSDLQRFEEDGGEVVIWKPEEMAEIMIHADPRIVPALAIAAWAGLRQSEIFRLQWEQVDMKSRFIEVKPVGKAKGRRRLVPIQRNLYSWLASHAAKSGPVLAMDEDSYLDLRGEAVATAQLEPRKNAWRHSYCSYRLTQKKDAAAVALECGHSATMLMTRYWQVVKPAAARRWFKIFPKTQPNVTTMPRRKTG